MELTKKQKDYYKYLIQFICERGYQPSYKDIGEHFKVYPRAVLDGLGILARKGFVKLGETGQERCLTLPFVRFRAVAGLTPATVAESTTDKTKELVVVVVRHIEEHGYQPTVQLIAEFLQLTKKSTIQRIEKAVKLGLIVEEPGRKKERALRFAGLRFEPIFDDKKAK